MTGFTGTWTSTPVTQLRAGDRVQWRSDVGIVQAVVVDHTASTVTIAMSRVGTGRRSVKTLPDNIVLMVQRHA